MKKTISFTLALALVLTLISVSAPAPASTPEPISGITIELPGAPGVKVAITNVYERYQRGSSNITYPDALNSSIFDVSSNSTINFTHNQIILFEWFADNQGWRSRRANSGETISFADAQFSFQRDILFRVMLGTTPVGGGTVVVNEVYFRFSDASANPPRGVTIKDSASILDLTITPEMVAAAEKLHTLGLVQGVGENADGTPNFALGRRLPRTQAITMFVRLLGKENEAMAGTWTTPFTDVVDWAEPYVGFAFENELTLGTGPTTFGTGNTNASQYITFVLRALGYEDGVDFVWNRAWELSDRLGITKGEYNAATAVFTRGNAMLVSLSALSAHDKNSGLPLYEILIEEGAITREAANSIGLG